MCWRPSQDAWQEPSTTHRSGDRDTFTITHPFHPLSGQRFEFVGYSHSWGEDRVFYRKPADERVYSIPAGWSDVEELDPAVAIGAYKVHFCLGDLIELRRLIDEINDRGV